jgi:hypothetical protein
MRNQGDIFAIMICAICAAGCVEDPAAVEEQTIRNHDGELVEQDGEPEVSEEIEITISAGDIGMGGLAANKPKTVSWGGCTFQVQHGTFIFTHYAKVRMFDCSCGDIEPIAVVYYKGVGLYNQYGRPACHPNAEWNTVTVNPGFGPALLGSRYIVIPTDARRSAVLAYKVI